MTSVSYREVEVKSALNAVKGMPFEWSLNPFLGCAHACFYCFSRAYHARYREKNVGTDFDSNVAAALQPGFRDFALPMKASMTLQVRPADQFNPDTFKIPECSLLSLGRGSGGRSRSGRPSAS